MTKFEQFLERKQREYGARFVRPSGSADLVAAYNDGGRYEVDVYGDTAKLATATADESIVIAQSTIVIERGRIGITTGWAPAFLLMHRTSDHGSSTLLDARTVILRKVAK